MNLINHWRRLLAMGHTVGTWDTVRYLVLVVVVAALVVVVAALVALVVTRVAPLGHQAQKTQPLEGRLLVDELANLACTLLYHVLNTCRGHAAPQ